MATPTPRVSGLLALLMLATTCDAARRRSDGTHLELRPKFIRPCKGEPNNTLQAVDVSYEMRGRTTVVFNINATFSKSVDGWPKGGSVIEQCDETVSAATCSTYRVLQFNDVCSIVMSPGMPWSKFVADFQPKISCPVLKGTHRLTNGTLSMELLNALSRTLRLEGYLWRIRAYCLDPRGATRFCLDCAGEFFRVRNRPKGSSR